MRTIELFCGTKSFSRVMKENGHEIFTLDTSMRFKPDMCADIRGLDSSMFPWPCDILWASPPCQGFSVAAIGKNWNKDYTPKSASAQHAQELVMKTLEIIGELKPKWWFIENPRGMLRKMPFMKDLRRNTVTYCQYGDTRMKPTDIWTNADWWKPKPACKNGDTCHVAAPRGSRTGTQGLENATERGRIPPSLFIEILEQMP